MAGVQLAQHPLRGLGQVAPLAQSRQGYAHGVQAVQQVGPEGLGLHRFIQAGVAGRQQLHVDAARRLATHGAHQLVVQEAQQGRLQLQRQVSDFVQQQGAAVGGQQQARAAFAPGAGKGTAGIAKQLGFKELTGQRRAIDGHKLAASPAHLVCKTGQQFFAGAGFALQQDGHVHAHRGFDQAAGFLHRRVIGHERGRRFTGSRGRQRRGRGRRPLPASGPFSRQRCGARRLAHEPRHQHAAQGVAQACVGAEVKACQHVVQGLTKQLFKARATHGIQPAEQVVCGPVQGHQHTLPIKGQQTGAQRAQEFGARVDGQDPLPAHLVRQQAVFNVRGRHLNQRLRVALARLVVRRSVQHAHHLAVRVAHRRRGARDVAQLQKIVLQAGDGNGRACSQRCAQAVGAGHTFGPHAAGQDARIAAAHAEAVVGVEVEDDALLVSKGQQEVAACNLARQGFQLGLGQAPDELRPFAPAGQVGGFHHGHGQRCRRHQARLQAARPAVQDHAGRQAIGRHGHATGPDGAGMRQRAVVARGQHGLSPRAGRRQLLSCAVQAASTSADVSSRGSGDQLHSFWTPRVHTVPRLNRSSRARGITLPASEGMALRCTPSGTGFAD